MGGVPEGSCHNYETLCLGIQNLFRYLSITIGLHRMDSSCR
jgi:hypothetical protein